MDIFSCLCSGDCLHLLVPPLQRSASPMVLFDVTACTVGVYLMASAQIATAGPVETTGFCLQLSYQLATAATIIDGCCIIDNRPTEKGLETRNFPFRCALRSRDLEMALASCSEHLQEL